MKNFRFIILIIIVSLLFVPFAANAATKKKHKTVRKIEIQLKDEMILTGNLTMPENASSHSKVPIVILLHSLGSNNTVYTTLSKELKNKNIASLAIDSRGHKDSTTKLSGKKSYWQNYSTKIYSKYPSDIVESINYVKEHFPSIDEKRIGIVAADINANAAILATNNKNVNIKNLVLISPSLSFKGLSPAQTLLNYGNHPVMFIATKNDVHSYNDALILSKYVKGSVKFITTQNGGTGDNILKVNPNLNKTIADWLSKNL